MSKVLCLAGSLGMVLLHTDTDSVHIKAADLARLESEFYKLYGRSVDGATLGKLHTDFVVHESKWE